MKGAFLQTGRTRIQTGSRASSVTPVPALLQQPNSGWGQFAAGVTAAAISLSLITTPLPSLAALPPGKLSATPQEVLEIVKQDFVDRKYLITGDLTKEVYADDAHFADSNNDFGNGLDSWVRGVKLLFVSDRCKLALTDDVVLDESARTITFKHWRQVDVFRIPGAPHTPVFNGRTVLTLDPVENIIVDHTEVWDQQPSEILKSLKFFDAQFNPPGFE